MTMINTIKETSEIAGQRAKAIMKKSTFLSDSEASSSSGRVIEFAITVIIVAAMIPAALNAIFNTSTAAWDASTIAIWGVLGVIIVAIVVLMLYNNYGGSGVTRSGGGKQGGF